MAKAKDPEAALRRFAEGEPVDMARARSDGDTDVGAILRQCRSKDPAKAAVGRLRAAVAVWRIDNGATPTD